MRTQADILVLDEPTAAMDAQAEAEVFEHFRKLAHDRIAILISHRFSTVRMADQIAVIATAASPSSAAMRRSCSATGIYARLFKLQAKGYR
jgi:ATP-binding cassette subfamily B protein